MFHGEGFRTDKGVENYLHKANQFLRKNGISTDGMSGSAVMGLYGKTFQTYKKLHPDGTVYTGRTSGTGTPEENVQLRDRNHHMNEKGFGEAQLDKSSSNPDAIRGAEQQGIEASGGAQSQGGTSGNAINGISDSNPKGPGYRAAAQAEFGAAEGEGAVGDTIEVIEILNDLDDIP